MQGTRDTYTYTYTHDALLVTACRAYLRARAPRVRATANTLGEGDDGRCERREDEEDRRKGETSRDVRHGVRHALEIGPRRSDLSYPHTPGYESEGGERTNEWTVGQTHTDGPTDEKEEKERQWQSSYVDRDISFTFVSRTFGESARERDGYRRYFPATAFSFQ